MHPQSRTCCEGQADLKLRKDLVCFLGARIIDRRHYTWPVGFEAGSYCVVLADLLC